VLVLVAGALAARSAAAEPSELPPAFAYNYGEVEVARSAALGGALHALGGGTAAPFLNPANMGLARVYHIGVIGQFLPEAARQVYGGAIVDSTRRFSGGVGLVGGFIDPDGIDRSYLDFRLALAFAITERVHFGLAGRYLNLDQEGLGPLGASRASGGLVDPDDEPLGRDALVNALTFDAGFTLRAVEGLHISAFGQNLSFPDNSLLPTLVGGGVGWAAGDFSIEADGLADLASYADPSPRVMVGGEYLVAHRVPIRLGYRFDALAASGFDASHALSGGLGYVDTSFSVEASVRRTLVGPSATFIVVGLAFHLESTGITPIEPY
jgi:hypothetical protein